MVTCSSACDGRAQSWPYDKIAWTWEGNGIELGSEKWAELSSCVSMETSPCRAQTSALLQRATLLLFIPC